MTNASDKSLLDALLDSWDRNHAITVNLLRAVPQDALSLRAADDSPTIAQMFTHMHFCRVLFAYESAPDLGAAPTRNEWADERDPARIAALLDESAALLREAARSRIESGRATETHYDHPVLLIQHFVWHEGYHHGQVKLALKRAGRAFDDEEIGPATWDVWMKKTRPE